MEKYDPDEAEVTKIQQTRILNQIPEEHRDKVRQFFIQIGKEIENSNEALTIFEREYLPKKKMPTINILKSRVGEKRDTTSSPKVPEAPKESGKISARDAMKPLPSTPAGTAAHETAKAIADNVTVDELKKEAAAIEEELEDANKKIQSSRRSIERLQQKIKDNEHIQTGLTARSKENIARIREQDPKAADEIESGSITARASVKRVEKGKKTWDQNNQDARDWNYNTEAEKDRVTGKIKQPVRYKTWLQRGKDALANNYTTVDWRKLLSSMGERLFSKADRSRTLKIGSPGYDEAMQGIRDFIDFWGDVKKKHPDRFSLTRAWGMLDSSMLAMKGVAARDKNNEFQKRAIEQWGPRD